MQAPKKTTTVKDALRARAGLVIEAPVRPSVKTEALSEGNKALPSAVPDHSALRAKYLELYGKETGCALIESRFRFSPAESDSDYLYLRAEPLLEQADGLLGHCAAWRTQFEALQIEKWKLRRELDLFIRLDEIEAQEREAGSETLRYQRAAIEAAAEQSLEENHRHAGDQLRDLTNDLVATGLNRRMAAGELAAWISAYPLKDAELRGDDANYTFDGVRKSKPEHLFEAARQQADEEAWEQIYSLNSRRFSEMGESDAGRLRKESLELQAKWELAAIGFDRARAQAVRDQAWEKLREARTQGSLLNFAERLAPLERAFNVDFRDALACLNAARRGLKELYDYAPAFPQEGAAGYFDEVAAWVARARSQVARFREREQSFELTISLKQLIPAQWEAGRAAAAWAFEIPEDFFTGQTHVRLRGVGLSLTGPAPELPAAQKAPQLKPDSPPKAEGFWWANMSAPTVAKIRLSGGVRELDQKALPAVFLGRVTDRDSVREPEIAGSGTLFNASPIGQWKLTLAPRSTDGMATARLQDVQIRLHIAARASV